MAAEVKETGIIMSGNHPRLILDGLKSMTRRTYGLEKVNQEPDAWELCPPNVREHWFFQNKVTGDYLQIKCPYGQVGDLLWVRETWRTKQIGSLIRIVYRADGVEKDISRIDIRYLMSSEWRSSLFLPKDYARIWCEITGLRAERLQEISFRDCEAEGIYIYEDPWKAKGLSVSQVRMRFARLWDSLNAKRGYGWDFNPWVWPINFKELKSE